MGLKVGDIVELTMGGPPMIVAELDEHRAIVFYFDAYGVLHDHAVHLGILQLDSLRTVLQEPKSMPEAMVAAKDAEAEAMKAERERQWAEDQVRYAHTTGFLINEGEGPGVTRTNDG